MAVDEIFSGPRHTQQQDLLANLDGSSRSPGSSPRAGPMARHWRRSRSRRGKIYWGNWSVNKISFANLDGSGGGDLNTPARTVNNPNGLALDPVTSTIYWANYAGNSISYARLDGSGGGDLHPTRHAGVPVGVAIDPSARKIYWANWRGNKISFANLDGSGGGDLNIIGTTVNEPWGVTVDPAPKVFWGNFQTDALDFANLQRTGGAILPTPGAPRAGPMPGVIDHDTARSTGRTGTAVQRRHVRQRGWERRRRDALHESGRASRHADGAQVAERNRLPAVRHQSQTPTTLSCSQGGWGGDLPGERLYRAPAELRLCVDPQWQPSGRQSSTLSAAELATTAAP